MNTATDAQIQKILIVGAGVIGSFNAARLKAAGHDVTLLARGRRCPGTLTATFRMTDLKWR